MKSPLRSLFLTTVLSGVLVSCSDRPTVSGEIVATNQVLASLVQMVVGDRARVVSIVPDGKDPHEFQPSAGDIARIAHAKVVVSNGFGYEPTLQKSVTQARAKGVPVFDVGREMPSLRDAHWFTDPLAAGEVIARLLPVMEQATGLDLGTAYSRAQADLQDTFARATSRLSAVPEGKCRFAVEHILLAPFGERFSCPGSVVLNTGSRIPDAQPSAKDIQRFAASIEGQGIRAVVEDVAEPSRVMAQVARQTGAVLVRINVHGLGGALTYGEYVTNIADALAGALS